MTNFTSGKSTFSSSQTIKNSSEYLLSKKKKLNCNSTLCNINESSTKIISQCEVGRIGITTPISYLD
jgi:hypothetical protein